MTGSPLQLPLALKLDEAATFENFWYSEQQVILVEALETLCTADAERWLYIAGPSASGKSHLLQAVSARANTQGQRVAYLNIGELLGYDTAGDDVEVATSAFDAFEYFDLLCIDDIQLLNNKPFWQEALFYLLVKLKAREDSRLIVAANNTPAAIGLSLPDLQSRLANASLFSLARYSDEEKIEILRLRAGREGLQLNREVASFLLARYSRGLPDLIDALHRLNAASLSHARNLTIPLIKETFNL